MARSVVRCDCGCETWREEDLLLGILACPAHATYNAVAHALGTLQHELREAHGDLPPRVVVEARI